MHLQLLGGWQWQALCNATIGFNADCPDVTDMPTESCVHHCFVILDWPAHYTVESAQPACSLCLPVLDFLTTLSCKAQYLGTGVTACTLDVPTESLTCSLLTLVACARQSRAVPVSTTLMNNQTVFGLLLGYLV